jgi:hypothetical protein
MAQKHKKNLKPPCWTFMTDCNLTKLEKKQTISSILTSNNTEVISIERHINEGPDLKLKFFYRKYYQKDENRNCAPKN